MEILDFGGTPFKLVIDPKVVPITVECDMGKVSDGTYSFDELYHNGCLFFLAFHASRDKDDLLISDAWKSRKYSNGLPVEGGRFIAGINAPQLTYCIPNEYWDLCKGKEFDKAREREPLSPADARQRLITWLKQLNYR